MAATDPVKRVVSQSSDHPVISDLDDALRTLAALPVSTSTPYVTA